MQAQAKIVETMKLLDEEAILRLYDMALNFLDKQPSNSIQETDLANIRRSQQLLSSIKGSLSDDIQLEREERC